MASEARIPIGLWSEIKAGQRWANEGVSRVIGFLVEGAATGGRYIFHIVVPNGVAETVREDLRQLNAVEGRDWRVWEPSVEEEAELVRKGGYPSESAADLIARFANQAVPVEGWVVTFPHFSGALKLDKPKATLFPDALPYDFQLGWPDGSWEPDRGWPAWRETATDVMADSDAVITFSRHVADRHAGPLCGVPIDKIRVIPLAPPDLAPQLPFLKDRRQTPASREKAANLLRSFADDRGIHYLKDFPFEEVNFVTAATQDRPSKNLGLTADAVRFLVREKRQSMKLILTAQLHFDADWSRLPILVSKDQLHRDILSLPDLPRAVHAALFHCATIVVHSSFFEGIVGALPFYEAASVGTPSLLARGPHVDELLALEPDLKSFTYDPYDFRQLAGLIGMIAADREAAVQEQAGIFERLSRNTWSDVASGYAEAALEGGLRQRER